jgi:hypothetical protein
VVEVYIPVDAAGMPLTPFRERKEGRYYVIYEKGQKHRICADIVRILG